MNNSSTPGLRHIIKFLIIASIMLFVTSACNSGGGNDEPASPQGGNWDQMQWNQDQWS